MQTYRVSRTDAEWQRLLSPEQYRVMRAHGTEPPGSCALLTEKRPGMFLCAGCEQPLFEGKVKFESGTGWPSFNEPVEGAIEHHARQQSRHGQDRGALRHMRQPSRPCLRRRPTTDRPALLHQRGRTEFQAGVRNGEWSNGRNA